MRGDRRCDCQLPARLFGVHVAEFPYGSVTVDGETWYEYRVDAHMNRTIAARDMLIFGAAFMDEPVLRGQETRLQATTAAEQLQTTGSATGRQVNAEPLPQEAKACQGWNTPPHEGHED